MKKKYYLTVKMITPDFWQKRSNIFRFQIIPLESENKTKANEEAVLHIQRMKKSNIETLKTLPIVLGKSRYSKVLEALEYYLIGKLIF